MPTIRGVDAQELRDWMEANGWSVRRLAERLDVDPRTVMRWRKGEWPVPPMAELALRQLETEGQSDD